MTFVARAVAVGTFFLLANLVDADDSAIFFEEPFTGQLDKEWVWLREDPNAWRLDQGTLAVVANGGSMWRTLNNYKNILMRPAPVEPKVGFQFEVLLDNEPQQQFEHAGLACRFDDDNYVVFNKEFLGQTKLLLIAESNAVPLLPGATKEYESREVWLRLTLTEGKVSGHYHATDKDPWQTMGEVPLPVSDKKLQIGLVAGLGKDGRVAKFHQFRIRDVPK